MAGPEGFEPPTIGFGVRRSTCWSYGPTKLFLQVLPSLFVDGVGPAELAVLLHLKPPGMGLLVLHSNIVALLALFASECDRFGRSLCHQKRLPFRQKPLHPNIAHLLVQCQFSLFYSTSRAGGISRPAAYSMTLVTTPEATVLPPSRMAKRSPSSMAMGWISSPSILTLSPGMTISTPSGSVTEPVTSVVLK